MWLANLRIAIVCLARSVDVLIPVTKLSSTSTRYGLNQIIPSWLYNRLLLILMAEIWIYIAFVDNVIEQQSWSHLEGMQSPSHIEIPAWDIIWVLILAMCLFSSFLSLLSSATPLKGKLPMRLCLWERLDRQHI